MNSSDLIFSTFLLAKKGYYKIGTNNLSKIEISTLQLNLTSFKATLYVEQDAGEKKKDIS